MRRALCGKKGLVCGFGEFFWRRWSELGFCWGEEAALEGVPGGRGVGEDEGEGEGEGGELVGGDAGQDALLGGVEEVRRRRGRARVLDRHDHVADRHEHHALEDAAGNPVDLTLPLGANNLADSKAIVIDTLPASVLASFSGDSGADATDVEATEATATPDLSAAERAELRELLSDLVANDPYFGGLANRV